MEAVAIKRLSRRALVVDADPLYTAVEQVALTIAVTAVIGALILRAVRLAALIFRIAHASLEATDSAALLFRAIALTEPFIAKRIIKATLGSEAAPATIATTIVATLLTFAIGRTPQALSRSAFGKALALSAATATTIVTTDFARAVRYASALFIHGANRIHVSDYLQATARFDLDSLKITVHGP